MREGPRCDHPPSRLAIAGSRLRAASPAACAGLPMPPRYSYVENDGTPELPDLIDQTFEALAHPA